MNGLMECSFFVDSCLNTCGPIEQPGVPFMDKQQE